MCVGRLHCAEGREAADRRREQVHLQLEGRREQGGCTPAMRKQQGAPCKEQVGEKMEGCLEKRDCSQEVHAETSAGRAQGKGGSVLCVKAEVREAQPVHGHAQCRARSCAG